MDTVGGLLRTTLGWICCATRLLTRCFGRCAVEGLLETTLVYFGSAVVDERWKGHSGACGVEKLMWATPGPLWWMCCGRVACYSGPTFGCGRVVGVTLGPLLAVEGLWGLLWDHFGKSAISLAEVLWKG